MFAASYDRERFADELAREVAGEGRCSFNAVYRALCRVVPFYDPADRMQYREHTGTWHSTYRNPGAVVEFVSRDDLDRHNRALLALLTNLDGALVPSWRAKLMLAAFA